MPDIAHVYGGDLQLNASGDLLTLDGDPLTQQRILHRLLTNAGDYIWELTYGAGLPTFVGSPVNAPAIAAVVRQQILLEDTVAPSPEPHITVRSTQTGIVTVTIKYTDADSGTTQTLSFPVV
jgi:hypothetical protein